MVPSLFLPADHGMFMCKHPRDNFSMIVFKYKAFSPSFGNNYFLNKSENPANTYTILHLLKLKASLIIKQTINLCSIENEKSCQFDGLYIHIT